MSRNETVDMCSGPLLKQIVIYTVPIILTGLLQLLFNAADLIVVGRFCGSVSVAAIGATGALTNLIVNLFIGLSVGAGVVVAQRFGARDTAGVYRAVHTAVPVALVGGAFVAVIGIVFSNTFLRWMGTPEEILPLSALYMKIYFAGALPTMVFNFGASILRARGETKQPLIFLTIAGVLNVILNLFFVLGFQMNVAGVALATAISQTVSAALIVIALMRREDACRLNWRELCFDRATLKGIVRIGLPAGIQSSLFAISNVLIQSSVNSFGAVGMSGNAAAQNIEGFVYVAMNAFQQTTMNFVGQNYGAKQPKRVLRVLGISLLLVFLTGALFGGLGRIFARPLLGLYITDSEDAILYALIRMNYVCVPYFLCGLMDTITGAMRGLGASLSPMIITVLGACGLRIFWVYTFFRWSHTPQTLYVSYPISWLLTFAAEMIAFAVIYRKKVAS